MPAARAMAVTRVNVATCGASIQCSHPPRLKLRYEGVERFSAQRVIPKVNRIPSSKSLVVHQRRDVAYLVTPERQPYQAGQP
jgi:hypothetical protein